MNTSTPPPLSRPFRYLADPLPLAAAAAYAANRWIFKPFALGGDFPASYLNDLLCLPLFLPPSLFIQRLLGLRRHDAPPRPWEIVQHWVVFSVVFEIVLPAMPAHFRSTADALDVAAYATGGIFAAWFWSRPRDVRGGGAAGEGGTVVRQPAGSGRPSPSAPSPSTASGR